MWAAPSRAAGRRELTRPLALPPIPAMRPACERSVHGKPSGHEIDLGRGLQEGDITFEIGVRETVGEDLLAGVPVVDQEDGLGRPGAAKTFLDPADPGEQANAGHVCGHRHHDADYMDVIPSRHVEDMFDSLAPRSSQSRHLSVSSFALQLWQRSTTSGPPLASARAVNPHRLTPSRLRERINMFQRRQR